MIRAPTTAVDITQAVQHYLRSRGFEAGALKEIRLTVEDIPTGQRLLGQVLQDAVAYAPQLVRPNTPVEIDGVRWAVFIPASQL